MITQAPGGHSGFSSGHHRLWGLGAEELHDAYWRSNGIQCVRPGQDATLDRAADLFLLIPTGWLVLFDLQAIADRLVWRAARLMRLSVNDRESVPYREQVLLDDEGRVERIERQYQPRTRSSCRLVLTRHLDLTQAWTSRERPRAAWLDVRRRVPQLEIDYWRCTGRCFQTDRADHREALMTHLVSIWHEPDRAIHGIEEARPGVWALAGQRIPTSARLVGPLWIGVIDGDEELQLVGPQCIADDRDQPGKAGAELRPIAEIEPDETRTPDAHPTTTRSGYLIAKRTFDTVMSALGLILLAPVFVAIAAAVIASDGPPPFYGHVRQSRGGRPFRCWKFRTMHRDAEKMKQALREQNACDGPQFFIDDDPRVTRVGKMLRRFHLDELPQLWNVLRGHMSLVGPRPSPDDENQICAAWRDLRLSVRPGITGLWQLKRTRDPGLDFQEWIRYDVQYVREASMWLDLTIIVSTLRGLVAKPRG